MTAQCQAVVAGKDHHRVGQAAISALTEGLEAELTPLGIQVTLVVPGFFRSNLADNLRGADAVMRARFQRFMSDSEITAEEVASSILAAMQTDTARVEVSGQRRQQWLKAITEQWLPAGQPDGMNSQGTSNTN